MKMKTIAVLGILLGFCASAEAKTIRVPRAVVQPGQLHEELLARFPEWRGTPVADGIYSDPVLRVEYTDAQVILQVPDDADEAALAEAIQSHVPDPNRRAEPASKETARAKLRTLGFTDDEIAVILR